MTLHKKKRCVQWTDHSHPDLSRMLKFLNKNKKTTPSFWGVISESAELIVLQYTEHGVKWKVWDVLNLLFTSVSDFLDQSTLPESACVCVLCLCVSDLTSLHTILLSLTHYNTLSQIIIVPLTHYDTPSHTHYLTIFSLSHYHIISHSLSSSLSHTLS